jgi:four helix bundle protein
LKAQSLKWETLGEGLMQNYRKLKVWEKAHEFTLAVYKISATFPKDELYGLTSQIRRSSVSIPSNIAEGCGREGDAEFGRFLQISMGSVNEVEYQLLLARDLKILTTSDHNGLCSQLEDIKRMLIALIKKVRADKVKEH